MSILQKKVYVAMSGGVDSSVAALLLKKAGYDVTGVFMKNWTDPLGKKCPWKKEARDFHQVCNELKIPGIIESFEEEYRKKVVAYLLNGYKKGITPNPDILCNSEIKFKVFLKKARLLGADFIATGHYVKKKKFMKGSASKYSLHKAKDMTKDQSYFLALLNQRQLRYSLFPVGSFLKLDIRKFARDAKLSIHAKKDSQGICFIGDVKFRDFIKDFIDEKEGTIITVKGEIIGKHKGVAFYTIGQRHGLGIGGGIPYYVTGKDIYSNQLIVGKGKRNKKLFSSKIQVHNVNWINGEKQIFPLSCVARVRYRQPLQKCTVYKVNSNLKVIFNNKQRAIAPGQFCVFYKGSMMLGGGVIL